MDGNDAASETSALQVANNMVALGGAGGGGTDHGDGVRPHDSADIARHGAVNLGAGK